MYKLCTWNNLIESFTFLNSQFYKNLQQDLSLLSSGKIKEKTNLTEMFKSKFIAAFILLI